jgi:hypothetical protein
MLRYFAQEMKTQPMSVASLADYFGVNWRTMKSMISVMAGVQKIGNLYRLPVREMPPKYLQEEKLFLDHCKTLHSSAIGSDNN